MGAKRGVFGVVGLLIIVLAIKSVLANPIPSGDSDYQAAQGEAGNGGKDAKMHSDSEAEIHLLLMKEWCACIVGLEDMYDPNTETVPYERCSNDKWITKKLKTSEVLQKIGTIRNPAEIVKTFKRTTCPSKPWDVLEDGATQLQRTASPVLAASSPPTSTEKVAESLNIIETYPEVEGSRFDSKNETNTNFEDVDDGFGVVPVVLAILTVLIVAVCVFGAYLWFKGKWAVSVSQFYPVTGGVVPGGTIGKGTDRTNKSN